MKHLLMPLALTLVMGNPTHGQSSSDKEKLADNYYNKGKGLWNSNTDSARYYLEHALRFSKEVGYLKGEANALKGLGVISQSNAEAIQYYTKALTIREQIKDSIGMGASLIDISFIYRLLGDKERMISYLQRSFEIRKKIKEYGGIAQCLIQFGQIKTDEHQLDSALENFRRALYYRLKAGEINGIAFAHVNIADALLSLKKYDSAIYFAQHAKTEFIQANNLRVIAWPISVIGECYFNLGQLDRAIAELRTADNSRESWQALHSLRCIKLLAEIYETKKDYKQALYFQKQWIEKNSDDVQKANNEETRKLAADYEFRIHELQLKQQQEKALAIKSRQDNLQFLVMAILLIVIFIFIISLRGKISEKSATILAFIGFLLLFEFLVVLFEPRLQSITRNEPFFILLGNVVIALLIAPIHSWVERKFKLLLLIKAQLPQK